MYVVADRLGLMGKKKGNRFKKKKQEDGGKEGLRRVLGMAAGVEEGNCSWKESDGLVEWEVSDCQEGDGCSDFIVEEENPVWEHENSVVCRQQYKIRPNTLFKNNLSQLYKELSDKATWDQPKHKMQGRQ